MKTTLAALLGLAGVFVVTSFTLVFGFVGFQNEANRYENAIKAQYTNNQNVYDNGWKKVVEVAQVPDKYTSQLRQIYTDTMQGRYGQDGSKALLQFITEQNPQVDATLYRQIQQDVEIFRNDFSQSQTELVSKKQAYANYLSTNTSSRFYNFAAGAVGAQYPHIDLSKYDIVTSGKTTDAFTTKQDEPLKLN